METELVIQGVGFPPFSARGCIQTLAPLETGDFQRTINGELIYTGKNTHHKYHSTITCEDKTGAALDGVWRGSIVEVHSLQRLWQQADGGQTVTLERASVPGSILGHGGEIEVLEGNQVRGKGTAKIFISYRPLLVMGVTKFSLLTDEWGMASGWSLHLEEV